MGRDAESVERSASTLARNLRELRGLIFRVTKDKWLADVRVGSEDEL